MANWKAKASGDVLPLTVDLVEVRAALEALASPEYAVQLQAAPGYTWGTFPGCALDGAVNWIERNADSPGLYYGINPVSTGLETRTKNGDVLCRRWLFVDVDRHKTAETINMSASDDEHAAAWDLAGEIGNWMTAQGWHAPHVIDSGNGWHLLYRIALDNDDAARNQVKDFLKALADRFDDDRGSVGVECHDARRLAKLPGTMARMKTATAERPHRMCRLVEVGDSEKVNLGALFPKCIEALKAKPVSVPAAIVERSKNPFVAKASDGDPNKAYGQKALSLECGRVAMAGEGQRNNLLNEAAFSLGTLVGGDVLARGEVEDGLLYAAERAGLGESEARSTIKSGIDAGILKPRTAPERNGKHESNGTAQQSKTNKIKPGERIIIRGNEIKPRKVEWLWPGRIPLGKLTTFAGLGGLGKTFVLCDITARVSRGAGWPDEPERKSEPGQVLFVSGEDDLDDTIIPRMIELNANLDNVVFLTTEIQDRFTLADLPTLDAAIEQAGPNVRFVAIDPPTAFLGGVDDHKNADLRGLLSPLKSWAARNKVAVIFNTHVNKGTTGKMDAMARVLGSVAWVNAVRAAHMFAKMPDDPSKRIFVGMKMNISKERKGLAYTIESTTDDLAKLVWLGEIDTTADEAVNNVTKPRKVVASEWLVERFKEKLEWTSEDLFRQAKEDGVSRNAVFEAKVLLDLPKARQNIAHDGSKTWVWWVPESWEKLGNSQCPDNPFKNGTLDH